MVIKIICVGKIRSNEIKILINSYLKKTSRFCSLEFIEIPDLKNSKNLSINQIKLEESKLIFNKLKNNEIIVALDENGEQLSSIDFSNFIENKMITSTKTLVFILGSAYGLSKNLKDFSTFKISFSKMTFSHEIARLIAIEQIFRAITIINNHPYHNK